MDDITLWGKVNDVSRDVELFKSEGEAIGLVLNLLGDPEASPVDPFNIFRWLYG